MTPPIDIAKAVGVMVNLDEEKVMMTAAFLDEGTGLDPHARCEALWESVKDDWPGYEHIIVTNDAAAKLKADRFLWQCGIRDDDNTMTVRIEAHNAKMASRAS